MLETIVAVTSAGFDVYMRKATDSWIYYTNGIDIAYLQIGGLDGISISSVHIPSRQSGSGFSIANCLGLEDLTREVLTSALRPPLWARTEGVKKFPDIQAFLNYSSWNSEYVCVAKRVVIPHEVVSDYKTVWVNGDDGCCIGRFSNNGVDVHRTGKEQLEGGSQCLDCCHDLPFEESWAYFKKAMLRHYGIVIDEEHKPKVKA